MKFSIGRMFDESVTSTSFGDIKESYPLYGQIEMVAASSELCTSATLSQLEDDLNCMSKTNEYDDLGMLKNTYVYDKNDSRVMTLTRNYQARTNDSMRISQRINMDTFAFGDESYWVRQYQYDAMGNVTKIYGETPDRHDYTYDYRNFLVNDNGTAYEYDGNGNITKKGTTTFTYDTVIKDRLVKVGNTPVTYSTENPLNPATYGNCSYNFKGRRLQSFTKSASTYNYIYDEQGLRTRKITPDGNVTKYLYNDTKLAAEIAPNYRLDFLYDENDMLYGFVKDGSAKYFYARDMLQNILGIIDTNGSPVVIYQYTAYGTSTVLQDTAGLANINPFRYKGYYFDSESGMYYCHTRYYVPEWCRWLNADHPSFLQPESLQGMNLFVYCGNNPVMHRDQNGNDWNSFWTGVGNFFTKTIPEWWKNDVEPFFTRNIPDFFTRTIPNWWNGSVVPWWNNDIAPFFTRDIPNFFTKTIPDFFVNTFWKDWIVDKVWNQFIVGTIWNKGLLPAWNWLKGNWKTLLDGISAVIGIGGGIAGLLTAFGVISIPVVGQVILAIVSIGFGIYGLGRAFKWW